MYSTKRLDRDTNLPFHRTAVPSLVPPRIDLRPRMIPVYDQGALGSCTANAFCAAVAFVLNGFLGSRLFLYYNERLLENTTGEDAGALMSDGLRALQQYGLVPEKLWPYQTTRFNVRPTPSCYSTALLHRVVSAARVRQDAASMRAVLASGYPFAVGIAVYESFESDAAAATGRVPMPNPSRERLLGGHAVLCVGYDDARGAWIMRNSWGTGWGDKGYFYLPYPYLIDPTLTSDLFVIYRST
ncbi:peptidase [bacterium]|nr:peptidase [bacterium]